MKIIPVILSGGSGTRLWPLSRKQYPKQYLCLASNHTMLQETILRLKGLENITKPVVVCNAKHRFLVAEQLQQIDIVDSTILLEPVGRNTAPAIASAAYQLFEEKYDEDAIMLVLSADHEIQKKEAFHQTIAIAVKQAQKGKLVIFGVAPTNANTGYGYIKTTHNKIELKAFDVEKFVEKPDKDTAEKYLKKGNYLWNSGMFMFKASSLISELEKYAPEIIDAVQDSVKKAQQDLDFIRLERKAFESSPSDSIDYAVMEKSDNVVVVPLDAGWNDIGSWAALYDISDKDGKGNVIKGDVITQDTSNCYINADHHMVATIGIDDLIIIDTPDATLVASKNKAQDVKAIVEILQHNNRNEHGEHLKVFRPWGWYDSIQMEETFQVKKLHVTSGSKLSLQLHHQRAEHWVVVTGVATVTKGDETLTLHKGESIYIPQEVKHSLENLENEPLEVIEVQSGTYLGEDDIVRFEDVYGRS